MTATTSAQPVGRQERRKAATRAKILVAADRLFGERGYAETSIEDISEAADVAVRTIYMHFSSKAAIMLAAFDSWVDAFVEYVLSRPVDEPVIETVRAALERLEATGREPHAENDDTIVHPTVSQLFSGAPDVAGHILQRWMHEMDRITRDTFERGDYPDGSLEPHARAVAIFAAWIGSLSAAASRERGITLPRGATGHTLGLGVLEEITSGEL
ncbi:MAG: TetR family transcriptional regulator [Leucobacter sp.]|nr:TetR family transcriptional regulator [Leucobacter sp.]